MYPYFTLNVTFFFFCCGKKSKGFYSFLLLKLFSYHPFISYVIGYDFWAVIIHAQEIRIRKSNYSRIFKYEEFINTEFKNEWSWHNICFIDISLKYTSFNFRLFSLSLRAMNTFSHLMCFQGPLKRSHLPEALFQWSLPTRRPCLRLLEALPQVPVCSSPPFWYVSHCSLLHVYSCLAFSWSPSWSQSSAPSLFAMKNPTILDISWSWFAFKFWPRREVTRVPPNLLPSGWLHPFHLVPSVPQSTASNVPVCLRCGHPTQGSSPENLCHIVPSPVLAASLSLSLEERTARNGWAPSPFWISSIFLHKRNLTQPSSGVPWAGAPSGCFPGWPPHPSGQGFGLPLAVFTVRK